MTGEQQRVELSVAPGFRRLFEPLTIGNFTVRNRIVNTTHRTRLSDDRDVRYLQERARGGVGLMGLPASQDIHSYSVGPGADRPGPAWDEMPPSPVGAKGIAHYDNVVIPQMRRRAEAIHAEGAKCFGQVNHAGASRSLPSTLPMIAPSAVADPYEAGMPHALTDEEIEELVVVYAHGVRRLCEAGLDAAEIHGAHGYLVSEFLSPYFNRRTDRWGGSIENRGRFVQAVVAEARKLVGPEFPIGLRIGLESGDEHGPTVDDQAELAAILAPGLSWISVSGGTNSGFGDGFETAYVSPWYKHPGFNVPAARAVKARVDVPVFVTGRIADPSIAESILAEGSADLIGMVRGLIADPELPNKARAGRADEIRMCVGMSECHHIGRHRVPVSCSVNAAAGREAEMEITPSEVKKTVVVVGAGPAGMEAARIAALRGHEVYLADRARAIGGTPRVLAQDPNRRNLLDLVAYFDVELRRLGVNLMLGNEVTAEELIEFAPDAVILACGGTSLVPDVPGIDAPNVVLGLDVLRGSADVGEVVVVVGGLDNDLGAPTIAEFLVDQGKDVEYISEHLDFIDGVEDATRLALMQRLAQKKLRISQCHSLVAVERGGATVRNTFTREDRHVPHATIVLACGLLPNDRMMAELRGKVPEVHLVGDALAPRRVMHATLDGARAARVV